MKLLGLQPEFTLFRDMRRDFILGRTSNPTWAICIEEMDVFKINDDDDRPELTFEISHYSGPIVCECSKENKLNTKLFLQPAMAILAYRPSHIVNAAQTHREWTGLVLFPSYHWVAMLFDGCRPCLHSCRPTMSPRGPELQRANKTNKWYGTR